MKFRNRKHRVYFDRMIEAGELVGTGCAVEWDGALDELLEPIDDDAKRAFDRLRLGKRDAESPRTFGQGVPHDTLSPATDVYRRYGKDMLRAGFDPNRVQLEKHDDR